MKYIIILITFLSILTSCKKINQEPYSIIGSWEQYRQITTSNGVETPKTYDDPLGVVYYEDGTLLYENSTTVINWELNGDQLFRTNNIGTGSTSTVRWINKYEWSYTYGDNNWFNEIFLRLK